MARGGVRGEWGAESRKQFLPHNSQSRKRNIKSLPEHPPPSNHAATASGPKKQLAAFNLGTYVNEVG